MIKFTQRGLGRFTDPLVLRWIFMGVVATIIYCLVGTWEFTIPIVLFDAMMILFLANELLKPIKE